MFANEIIIIDSFGGENMEYLPIQDYANNWNISKRRIQILCKEGRIPGAKMIGNMWVIPEKTERPVDARIKNPVKEEVVGDSVVRRELKKLLRLLYDSCIKNGVNPKNQKDYVLSVIAGELCSFYLGNPIDSDMFTVLYENISMQKPSIQLYAQDSKLVNDFIRTHESDVELDNILSWAYQYSNKYIQDNTFSKTQFFTEKYMIQYLVENIENLCNADKILDPCVGGGNFLVECLEELCNQGKEISEDALVNYCSRLYGFDIDNKIARIAVANIRLRVFAILKRNNIKFDVKLWDRITPNIYMSHDSETIQGSLTKENKTLINAANLEEIRSLHLFKDADVVLTNPPFATVKGMRQDQKEFLKKEYPLSNCDTCVAFMESIYHMLSDDGICGIVSQSAWMYLKSFDLIRKWIVQNYELNKIVNLGSGAFLDLNGEKSNVSLLTFSKRKSDKDNVIKIFHANTGSYQEKVHSVEGKIAYLDKKQSEINGNNGFNFAENDILSELKEKSGVYKDIAVPMQGTSTGDAKELVGFFWEHFGDPEWVSVSNGGGYCRWLGLNDSVVKWGNDGEYIRAQKGSALRNVKYFPETQMVFSDTGTAGLNVRLLHENQIFIASGPGIRIKKGNKYAHMALLNSRIASYFLRLMSPKLTIAAGYIGQIPVNDKICSSVVLEKNARLCVDLKEKQLSIRANNFEYSDEYFDRLPSDIEKASWVLFNEDITNELLKLELEWKTDVCIMDNYGLSEVEKKTLDENVGKCAYEISGSKDIDLVKLDSYLDKLLDSNCCLKRTKNSKGAIGSDGFLEYTSKDLSINPETIVRKIQENPYKLVKVMKKYRNLILHNFVLHCLGYKTNNSASLRCESIDTIVDEFHSIFGEYRYGGWIKKYFNEIHTDIFKGKPYLIYDKGVVRINDRYITKQTSPIYNAKC
jgi:hypothetical protein